MKDKRIYLKIACIIELIYIIGNVIYNLFFNKTKEEVIAVIFMQIISLFFTYILYKESKKEISYLKNNKMKLIICSIWFLLDPVITGVLGFIFLNSLKEKKEIELPKIKENKLDNLGYIKVILTVIIFALITFILPNFKFYNKIPMFLYYIFILIFLILFNYKELKDNLVIFIKNRKTYFPFIIKRYFIMLGIMIIVAIPIVLINGGQTSNNQQTINSMFEKLPFFMLLLTTLYAPLTEEIVFRLSFSKLIHNKRIFIIVSGVLFGILHVIDDFTSISQLLYVFQYSALGICLAKAYYDTKNIFVSISIHFIQNFIAALLVLLLNIL